MNEQWIERSVDGSRMPCFVAEPEGVPRGAVVVIQEIFGVNEPMVELTRLVASAGYLGIAPAVFHRTDPEFRAAYDAQGFAKGRAAAGEVSAAGATADLFNAAAYARERLGAEAKVATWGFCFGGALAVVSATLPQVDAAISFYGAQIVRGGGPALPPPIDAVDAVRAPVLFAFGGKDEHIGPEARARIREAFDAARKPYEFYVYAEEDHGFFRQGPSGNAGSADVWPIVQRFLSAHIG